MEIWGGIECSINRVGDCYFDQLAYSGHYEREGDISSIVKLGVSSLRYPILWEKYLPSQSESIDWTFAKNALSQLARHNVIPIVGLVHHGSGPNYVNFFDGSFETGLASYAKQVAAQFPEIEFYTPVNEPLTTARFCGLYGFWYPHKTEDYSFLKILLSECKATVMAMEAIRSINPNAKLVQTEDLGKTYSTPKLAYQADFENRRRWLSYDLLFGKVNPEHPLWKYIIDAGIEEEELYYFLNHPCPPDIIGCNYYVTSERYLDDNLEYYPASTYGGNGAHYYADVEAIRVNIKEKSGYSNLVKELWKRYYTTIAVTEVHLHCSREEQLRWFDEIWNESLLLELQGVDVVAVTSWALLGSFGWDNLLRAMPGTYEPGVYDIRANVPRPMALAGMIKALAKGENYHHPLLNGKGWWKRNQRLSYQPKINSDEELTSQAKPILILGKTGTLGQAFEKICKTRGIPYKILSRQDFDISKKSDIVRNIAIYNPWAIVNATGYVRVDEAENEAEKCFQTNSIAARDIATACEECNVKYLAFSSDLVFDGKQRRPYSESQETRPLNVYGKSKSLAEKWILQTNPKALLVRTSAFFGIWDTYNFVTSSLEKLKKGEVLEVSNDLWISPTYVPDLVNTCLDLLADDESGIWHITNSGQTTWYDFAREVEFLGNYSSKLLKSTSHTNLGLLAPRPTNSALISERGILLPHWRDALMRYFNETNSFNTRKVFETVY